MKVKFYIDSFCMGAALVVAFFIFGYGGLVTINHIMYDTQITSFMEGLSSVLFSVLTLIALLLAAGHGSYLLEIKVKVLLDNMREGE